MSAVEAEEKAKEEISREASSGQADLEAGIGSSAKGLAPDAPRSQLPEGVSVRREALDRAVTEIPSWQDRRARLQAYESKVGDQLLVAMQSQGMELRPQAKIGDPGGTQVRVDFAGWDKAQRKLVVCEVMMLGSLKNLRSRLSLDVPALIYRLKKSWPTPNIRIVILIATRDLDGLNGSGRNLASVQREMSIIDEQLDLIFVNDSLESIPTYNAFREVLLSQHKGVRVWFGTPEGQLQ
jgi:hypothetical protein